MVDVVLTRSRRRVGGALAVLVLVLLALAPAAAIAAEFGPEQVVIRSRGMQAGIRSAVAADGVVHGFSTVTGTEPDEVRYVEGRGSRWRVEATPYRGHVLSTAVDATGSYLLYRARDGLRVTKRLADGRYTAGHLLLAETAVPPAGSVQADLVAAGGRWWAVWGLEGGHDLWEAGTFGGVFRSGRVAGSSAPDSSPTLALTTTGPQEAVLVWLRSGALWAARASRPGAWRDSRQLGGPARYPELVVDGSTLHLAFFRAGRVFYGTGPWQGLRTGPVPGPLPSEPVVLAASRGRVFLVCSQFTGSEVMLIMRSSPTGRRRTSALWTNSYDWHEFAVTAHRGLGTVFVGAHKSLKVLARSQER